MTDPSVSAGAAPILEAHLLDFDCDLYGREVVVKLEHKIAAAVAAVRAYFAAFCPPQSCTPIA